MFLKSAINSSRAKILSKFPNSGGNQFKFCFAYGSAVKQQLGYDVVPSTQQSNMIDMIFCVRDSLQWHGENIKMNPHHYSAMRMFGANVITSWQKSIGARTYFNTLVPIDDNGTITTIKYGVVSEQHLIDDLHNWTHLYLAGRLHKPIECLHSSDNRIEAAVEQNLCHALRTALVLLPEQFSWYQLFYTISSLSYDGDFRMIFGENKNKVHNIVQSQLMDFQEFYARIIVKLEFSQCLYQPMDDGSMFKQCKKSTTLSKHLHQLPNEIRSRLMATGGFGEKSIMLLPADERLEKLSQFDPYAVSMAVKKTIDSIVWRSSILQSIKNIPTAGIGKSLQYSWKKALKTFQS